MRILQVVRQYLPSTGGMETYVSNLCRQLTERGHECDVATLDYLFKSGKPLPRFEVIDGINIIRLPSSGNARYFLAPRLLELLPRYDLVNVHGVDFFIDLLGTFKNRHGTPVILTTHGGFFHTPWFPALKEAFFQTITRHSLKGVDRVIASSQKDAELFSRVTDNITVVDNGIDFQTFAAVEKDVSGPSLIYVCRISKNKRVDRLLDTFAHVRESTPDATLTIIGPDWEGLQAGLEEQAARLSLDDAVTFAGKLPQDEMLKRQSAARLFVSASEYEAFGLSTVEAMATGTVPVVNNIPAFADFVEEGVNGYLTDYSDSATAAAAIVRALGLDDDRLAEMGSAARRTASRYDWRVVAGRIVDIYEEVMKEQDQEWKPLDVLGVRIDHTDRRRSLELVSSYLESPGCKLVITVNPEHVMMAEHDAGFREILNSSDLNVADGIGIIWASRLLGAPLPERIAGSDLLPGICEVCERQGKSIFLLGGQPGVADVAAANLIEAFPALRIAGTSSSDPDPSLDGETVAAITSSGATVLAVAYGSPTENLWIERNRASLEDVRLAIGVGGTFDFLAGEVPRAPEGIRNAGMEWLYRLWQEPRRYRRMMALPRFGWQVLRARAGRNGS